MGRAQRPAIVDLKPVPIAVDDEGISLRANDLRQPPRFIFVTPSHQYPLGLVMSLSRRRMLLEYASAHNVWIIEDDYDSEFRYGSRPLASLQGLDHYDRVIYLGSFSKTLFPGLRIGYLVVPQALAAPFATGLSELYREGQLFSRRCWRTSCPRGTSRRTSGACGCCTRTPAAVAASDQAQLRRPIERLRRRRRPASDPGGAG